MSKYVNLCKFLGLTHMHVCRLTDVQACFKVIHHLKHFQLSALCVLWHPVCLLSYGVEMTQW